MCLPVLCMEPCATATKVSKLLLARLAPSDGADLGGSFEHLRSGFNSAGRALLRDLGGIETSEHRSRSDLG